MIDLKITSVDSDGLINLTIGPASQKTIGLNKLVQQVVKMLLQTPGTDVWEPGAGGGMKTIVGRNVSNDDAMSSVRSDIGISVMNTERYLMQEQIGYNIPDEEKLKSLTLSTAEFNRTTATWSISVLVENFSEETAELNIN